MGRIDFEQARYNMIEQQIRTWDVLDDRVLDIVGTTPREAFVPERYRNIAFTDMQIKLPHDQVMMEPKLEARVLQTVNPQPHEHVLDIGTGSGYLAACLSRMSERVTSVELFPELSEMAAANLKTNGVRNVDLIVGDAARGWDDGRRYDVIVVTGSLPEMHLGFHQSLAVNGRLFLIVGQAPIMEAILITRVGESDWTRESLFETSIKPLIGAPVTHRFAL